MTTAAVLHHNIKTLRKQLEVAPGHSQPRLADSKHGKVHFVNRNSLNPFSRLKSHAARQNERKAALKAVEEIFNALENTDISDFAALVVANEKKRWTGDSINNHQLTQIFKVLERALDVTQFSPGTIGASLQTFTRAEFEKMLGENHQCSHEDISAFYKFLWFVAADNVEQIQDIWAGVNDGQIKEFNWHEKASILKVAAAFSPDNIAAISDPKRKTVVMVARAIQRATLAQNNAAAPAKHAQPSLAKPALAVNHDLAKQRPQLKNFADADALQLASALITAEPGSTISHHADKVNKAADDVRAFQKFLRHVLSLSQEQIGDAWRAIQNDKKGNLGFTHEDKKRIGNFVALIEKHGNQLGTSWSADIKLVVKVVKNTP